MLDTSHQAQHGTEWRYSVDKCRCQPCKTAHAYAARLYRQRRKARGGRLLHGRWVAGGSAA